MKIFFLLFLLNSIKNDGYEKFFEVSGGPQYMYYFAKVYVGTPPVEQSAIIDTGSDTLAFPCDQCESRDCGTHQDPRFYTGNSSTFDFDMDCSLTTYYKNNNVCQFIKSYAEGSSLLGFLAEDYIRFKNSHRVNDSKLKRLNYKLKKDLRMKAEFGCTTKETGLFKTQYADGIFGLDNDSTLIDSMEKSATQKFKRPMSFNFGLCFHEKGGIMSIDLRSTDHDDNKLRYLNKRANQMSTPLVFKYQKYKSYYEIIVHKFKIGNEEVSVSPIDMMVDSGTTFTHMPTSYVEKILNTLNEYCKTHPNRCGKIKNPNFDTESCLELKQPDKNYKNIKQLLASFPTIEIFTKKNDKPYVMFPQNYFYEEIDDNEQDPNVSRVCMALKGEEEGKIILGAFGMVDYYFYFDRKDKELRIYKEDCYVRTMQLLMKKERILSEVVYQKVTNQILKSFPLQILMLLILVVMIVFIVWKLNQKGQKGIQQSLISETQKSIDRNNITLQNQTV